VQSYGCESNPDYIEVPEVAGMTLHDAFELYRTDYIVFKNQSPRTEEAHNYVRNSLITFLGDIEIEDLEFKHIRDWKTSLEKTRSPDTVRTYIIRVRVVLAWLRASQHQVLSPDVIPVPKRVDKVPQFITKEEVCKLIDAAEVYRGCKINTLRNKAVISLLYCSGLRVSELCALNRGDIRGNTFTVVGKGGKARLCFVDERTSKFITEYLSMRKDGNQALFICSQNGLRITKGNIQFIFRTISKRSGIEGVHPHTMRHSFATNLLRNNCNLRYVQELLGHASLQTTQQYTHIVNYDLEQVYQKFHSA
jgi:integrase/recombinase XerD